MGQINGWYNVWMDSGFKLHDDLQNVIHRRFNAHLHFCFNYNTREGGKFTINTTKRCLFRLIELQPVECLFRLWVESSFFLHTPSVREPSVVFETALLLCCYSQSSISSSQIFGGSLFLKKFTEASLHLIHICEILNFLK